jgi:hypothetical protein
MELGREPGCKIGVMADSRPGEGRVFISYRREETAYPAGWLFDRLTDHFGKGQIFKDVDSIELGDDFVEVISGAVGSCDVLLALIGDRWVTITDDQGKRRLDDPNDFVRLEIEAALVRNVRVIPILVDGARMPRAEDLPPSLAKLVRRQALELSPARFDFDTGRLVRVLDKTLAEVRTVEDGTASGNGKSKPQGQSVTELPEGPGRHEHTPGSRTHDRTPAVAIPQSAPAEARESEDKTGHRLRARAPILAAVAVVVVAIAVFIITIVIPDSAVILEDDFSDRNSGWKDVGDERLGGHYANGAYNIYVEAGDAGELAWGSAPENIETLFPKAPSSLSIEVEGEKLAGGSHETNGYGIFCRGEGEESDYAFILGRREVTIGKTAGGDFNVLDTARTPAADPNARNELGAVCKNVQGNEAVHLEFSVNGEVVAAATDTDDPLLSGTIGLFVYTVETQEVEFDNFVVTEL